MAAGYTSNVIGCRTKPSWRGKDRLPHNLQVLAEQNPTILSTPAIFSHKFLDPSHL
jgi:hypothetical protein